MVIAQTTTDDHTFLLLGLSRVNIERLMAGQPIKISRATHGTAIPENLTLSLLFGETEQAIAKTLNDVGMIGEDTRIKVDPRLE